jgi:hypothetical protein
MRAMWMLIGGAFLAWLISSALWTPPARELVIKLGTLMDMARRANPELYAARLEPITPFVSPTSFKLQRVTKVLRADVSEFGVICQRLHREAKKLDRRAHYALAPMILYVLGVGAWWLLSS